MRITFIALLSVLLMLSCTSNSQESTESKQELNPKKERIMKILLVLTSHDELGETGQKTGFWLAEFADPYYYLVDKGIEVTLASPKGGLPPIDPKSELPDFQTESTKRFNGDEETQDILAKTVKLASVKQEDFDLILMDIQMPIKDGYTATSEIRNLQNQHLVEYSPIVALTANATEEDRKKALENNMDDFLTKPIMMEALREIIKKHVNPISKFVS